MRPCVLALGVVGIASSVRADTGTAQQLGAQPGTTQTAPAISGSGVVWTHFDGSQYDIYYQDVASGGAPRNLTASRGENEFLEDIDKGTVVYIHTGGVNQSPGDIFVVDTASGSTGLVAGANDQVHYAHPAISGNYIVFERITNGVYDIDVYDLSIGGSPGPQVTNDAATQLHPRVSGDIVVYEDYSANPSVAAVYGYHIANSGPTFRIDAVGSWPDIDGNNVVYVGQDAGGSQQIVLYDVNSATSHMLTSARSGKSMPRISGTTVVWTDDRNGDADVYSYDLTSGTESLLAGGAGLQTTGDISGGRVVYGQTDATNNNGVVFLYNIPGVLANQVPAGCDLTRTVLVDGPIRLSQTTRRPVYAGDSFTATATRSYFMCIENGLPDGSQRSANVLAAVDGKIALTPADFKADPRPPHYVATALTLASDGSSPSGSHDWNVALFAQPGTTLSVSIRVAK